MVGNGFAEFVCKKHLNGKMRLFLYHNSHKVKLTVAFIPASSWLLIREVRVGKYIFLSLYISRGGWNKRNGKFDLV